LFGVRDDNTKSVGHVRGVTRDRLPVASLSSLGFSLIERSF
jgi:hypothetical protein